MRTPLHLVSLLVLLAAPAAADTPLVPAGPDDRIDVHLPGPKFFPEGIASASDGSLYVGSLGTGAIVRVPPNALGAVPFAEGRDAFGVYGVAVDEARGTLWACTYDDLLYPNQMAALTAYALDTGAKVATYPLPDDGIVCNDLAVDADGTVYATDSFMARIMRLAPGGAALEIWSTDPAYVAGEWQWGLNGAVLDGAGGLWVVKTETGELFRVPILADGSAGAPVLVPVEPALVSPDGIERVDADTLLVVENAAGQVSVVKLGADGAKKEVIATGFVGPTTAALAGNGTAWVLEGQLIYFGTDLRPQLPFRAHRVSLP